MLPAAWNPPTVSDTKQAFYENFKKPIPAIYNTVLQELLVQQHLLRWNHTYQYDEVTATPLHADLHCRRLPPHCIVCTVTAPKPCLQWECVPCYTAVQGCLLRKACAVITLAQDMIALC